MGAQFVEAVWVWYFGKSAQKATYGRFNEDKSFTKDYLQVSGQCRDLMMKLLPASDGEERTALTFRWPGGDAEGFVKHSVDRHHLTWKTTEGAPPPWRLTPNPSPGGPGTIPGDPGGMSAQEASVHLDSLEASGIKAYLVAVKLHDENDVLHIRTYIENPSPALTFADSCLLPEAIRDVMAKATPKSACSSIYLEGGGAALTPDVSELIEKFEENPNLLFVGPPGTGKTVLLEKLTRYIENPGHGIQFDPSKNHDAWSEATEAILPGKTRTVVLHPNYSYDSLVLGLMPVPAENGVQVKVSTGPLINLAHYASSGARAILVLDEFNRGNAAAVLGDALALLDKDKRGTAFVDLPYGDLEINVPLEFAVDGNTAVESRFTLPANLWIAAAMNSSDRSVAPLDAALRRRFSIIEMPPDYEALDKHIGGDADADLSLPWEDWSQRTVAQLAISLLRELNNRIDAVLGQDFRLGQSNFWHVSGTTASGSLRSLAMACDRRVTQTLRLSLQDDDEMLGAILMAGSSDSAHMKNTGRIAWWKAGDVSLGAYASPRLHFNDLADLETGDLHAELIRLAGI